MIHILSHNEKTPEFGFTRSQTLLFIPRILPMTSLNSRLLANPRLRLTTQTVPENMTGTYQQNRVGAGETKILDWYFYSELDAVIEPAAIFFLCQP